MEVIVGNHGMIVLYDEDMREYHFYCRCLDFSECQDESSDFGIFNIYDTIKSDEIDIGISTSISHQSYESFDEVWSDNESTNTNTLDSNFEDIHIIRRECPYCRYTFDKKVIEKELFNDKTIDDDIKLDIISMIPIEWDKTPKYRIPIPDNRKKFNRIKSIPSISSWDNLCVE